MNILNMNKSKVIKIKKTLVTNVSTNVFKIMESPVK